MRKLFSQNVFWIDCGSGKHKKKYWRFKEGEKGKKFDKKVNSSTRYKIGGRRVVVVPFFFANPIPSSARPLASLRSNKIQKFSLFISEISQIANICRNKKLKISPELLGVVQDSNCFLQNTLRVTNNCIHNFFYPKIKIISHFVCDQFFLDILLQFELDSI